MVDGIFISCYFYSRLAPYKIILVLIHGKICKEEVFVENFRNLRNLLKDPSVIASILGSVVLAGSIFSLLPISETVKKSDAANFIVAILGACVGFMLGYICKKRKNAH